MSYLALAKKLRAEMGADPDGATGAPRAEHASSPGADYGTIYATITASTGTAEDLAACSWWYDLGNRGLPAELAALEGRCEQLVHVNAPEPDYRVAVEQLVARIREIRDTYRGAQRRAAGNSGDAGDSVRGSRRG